MPALNPEHLLDQASRLIAASGAGKPRQADLRRAISCAYYALFHHVVAAAADEFIGRTRKHRPEYSLAYRSIDHQRLREICTDLSKQMPPQKYASFIGKKGLGDNIRAFATALIDLQEKRHAADYDPRASFRASDALLAISTSRDAMTRFGKATSTRRRVVLSLIAFRFR